MTEVLFDDLPEGTNEVTGRIVEAAIRVHRALGPGLLERPYHLCLLAELEHMGLKVASKVPIRVEYRGVEIDCAYEMDLLVEDLVIIEVKAVASLDKVHLAQALTYLKLAKKPVALVINFNVPRVINGIRRVIDTHRP